MKLAGLSSPLAESWAAVSSVASYSRVEPVLQQVKPSAGRPIGRIVPRRGTSASATIASKILTGSFPARVVGGRLHRGLVLHKSGFGLRSGFCRKLLSVCCSRNLGPRIMGPSIPNPKGSAACSNNPRAKAQHNAADDGEAELLLRHRRNTTACLLAHDGVLYGKTW